MVENEAPGYRIWAVDNVVYGPVDLPVLVGWVKEERVTAGTWIYSEEANRWLPASQMDELQLFFRKKPAQSIAPQATPSNGDHPSAGVRPGMLRRMRIFAGMSDEQIQQFIDFMEVVNARQFSEIVRQGSPGDAMFLILDGEVRVRLMIAGKETILATLPAGEFFGEISLFDHGVRSADVVANLETTLLRISAGTFQRVIMEAPALATPFLFAIGKTLTARIRADNKRFQDSINFARTAR